MNQRRSLDKRHSVRARVRESHGVLVWMFRSRKTGRITVAQPPNWKLSLWAIASAGLWLGDPSGWVREVVVVIARASLAVWAADELVRGVNPFRRLLGGVALAWIVYSLVDPA